MPATKNLLWGNLLHLSFNMWADRPTGTPTEYITAEPQLRFDQSLWDDILHQMAAAGMNMAVLDLGDGVRYESHPEIAVQGAWSVPQLQQELAKARALGIEVIPKLNFSTCHDTWLGPYSRMVSTDQYYQVCKDLISEVIHIFDTPRLFHLGMDEENYENQAHYAYVTIRQFDLWWHDLYYLVEQVERGGVRAWVWSDYLWTHPHEFFHKMPRSVMQSNWYYGQDFGPQVAPARAYQDLESHGYDQIPTGSNWSNDVNFERTVAFGREYITPERLWGFLQTSWKPTIEACRTRHQNAIEQVHQARSKWSKGR